MQEIRIRWISSIIAAVAWLGWGAPPAAAAPESSAQQEIAQLIGSLDGAPCRFQRNGRWHDAAEARAHLQRKYDYLLKKNQVGTAEQFIARAASQSSLSGKPYRIACPGQPEQTAAAWFGARLAAIRQRTP